MNRSSVSLRALAWFLVVAWAGTIFYLSTMTGHEVEQLLPWKIWDKALHFLVFAFGALLLAIALRITAPWSWRLIMLVTILGISLYGASDEWHQQWTPGRSAKDVGDWTADTLGALAGALACGLYAPYRRRVAA
jgi:VanZ family protein